MTWLNNVGVTEAINIKIFYLLSSAEFCPQAEGPWRARALTRQLLNNFCICQIISTICLNCSPVIHLHIYVDYSHLMLQGRQCLTKFQDTEQQRSHFSSDDSVSAWYTRGLTSVAGSTPLLFHWWQSLSVMCVWDLGGLCVLVAVAARM